MEVSTRQNVAVSLYDLYGQEIGFVFDDTIEGRTSFLMDSIWRVSGEVPYLPETTYTAVDSLEPGVYLYRVVTAVDSVTKKMMLLR